MNTTQRHRAQRHLGTLTSELALPPADRGPSWGQSLAHGSPGIALLHIERAATGLGDWDTVHTWLRASMRSTVRSDTATGLFFGAEAVAFAVHTAAAHGPGAYTQALATLDTAVAHATTARLEQAHARITQGERPAFAEFDLIYGLTGTGALLRQRDPHGALLRDVLTYLVRLTEPLPGGEVGWWTDLAPSGKPDPQFPGGHGNFGIAHGITGPLALLALALRDGIEVPGQREAIGRITAWLDTWQQDGGHGTWWPDRITPTDERRGRPHLVRPARPSWCYGTPGIARAQQLAALATGDTARQKRAELAMLAALGDPRQTGQFTDTSLCHGTTGALLTAHRIVADAASPHRGAALLFAAGRLADREPAADDAGLLEGAAGIALALHTAAREDLPASGWDACLLLT
ncbi:lanthionine synthetase C family protein [Kitasatospora sp. NPDC101801]|uniref:lanthionine synthetase C family protein n=1 Tax=Kitasatospora sp. NPDC101801 TaxID=3364103 RepID=UPI003819C03E